jgi:hypothetical protein
MANSERGIGKHTEPRVIRGGSRVDHSNHEIRIQATLTYGHLRGENERPINPELAKTFWDLLEDVRKPFTYKDKDKPFKPSLNLKARINTALNAACQEIPDIRREVLEKIITEDPLKKYPETWIWSTRNRDKIHRCSPDFDFPLLAANWNNDMFRQMRKIAENDYGVGPIELDFLRAVFEQQPPSTPCYGIYDLQIYGTARKAERNSKTPRTNA